VINSSLWNGSVTCEGPDSLWENSVLQFSHLHDGDGYENAQGCFKKQYKYMEITKHTT
jgi:hypothetical protein